MLHNRLNSSYLIVIYFHLNLRMYKRWLDAQYGFYVIEHAVSELYRLAHETVKASLTYRDFIVNIIKHLSTTTLWANK